MEGKQESYGGANIVSGRLSSSLSSVMSFMNPWMIQAMGLLSDIQTRRSRKSPWPRLRVFVLNSWEIELTSLMTSLLLLKRSRSKRSPRMGTDGLSMSWPWCSCSCCWWFDSCLMWPEDPPNNLVRKDNIRRFVLPLDVKSVSKLFKLSPTSTSTSFFIGWVLSSGWGSANSNEKSFKTKKKLRRWNTLRQHMDVC